jgi:uncharacterized protein YecE (DUF72 family)
MDIHVGTSGFSFPGWRTQVYPHTLKPEQMFGYYCRRLGFDCVELNGSFYHMPSAKSLASLAQRSPEGFGFMVKVNQAFTHNRFAATGERFRQFVGALQPLAETGKLRGLLAQFPPDFLPSPKAVAWLRHLRDGFAPWPVFMEFRHRGWDPPKVIQELRKEDVGYCITDLPKLPPLPTFVPAATTKTAYVRMHGRNREWRRPSTSRYDYSYSDFELTGIIARLRSITPSPGEAYVFFNNCYSGRAVRSAKRFQELLVKQRALG